MSVACIRARIVFGAFWVSIAAVNAGAVHAAERVHMPFDCYFDGTRVHLEPSRERSYEVIGPRDREIFTACAPYDPGRCRSWRVHRFDFQCGEERVSWLDAVLTGARAARRDIWVEAGRLHMRMSPMWTIARKRRRRPDAPFLREMPGVDAFAPDEFGDLRASNVVTVPPGFAPALGIPLAFSGTEAGIAAVERDAQEHTQDIVRKPLVTADAALPPPAPIPALPERAPRERPPPAVAAAVPAPSEKTAAVDKAALPATGANKTDSTPPPQPDKPEAKKPSFTIINAKGAQSKVPSRSAAQSPAAQPAARAPAASTPKTSSDDAAATKPEPTTGAAAQAPAVDSPAPPIQTVPEAGDDGSSVVTATAAAATVFALVGLAAFGFRRWRRGSAAVSASSPTVPRDIGSIMLDAQAKDPALTSQPETASRADGDAKTGTIALDDDLPIPTNYTQALHVLGASPDASTDAIKKIVDGLRKSWHPDHANSESDRVYREKRARQINVAWDLVSQRHKAA